MIGVVLAAHGDVGPALLQAAEAIVGPLEAIRALSLQAGEDPENMRRQVGEAVAEVDRGEGVLVLCDMFGGTPANVCLSTTGPCPVEVVTGVNLPMIIKLATARAAGGTPQEIASQLAAYGQRHIAHATELLREKRSGHPTEKPARPGASPR